MYMKIHDGLTLWLNKGANTENSKVNINFLRKRRNVNHPSGELNRKQKAKVKECEN